MIWQRAKLSVQRQFWVSRTHGTVLAAMRLCLLHALLKNSRAPDLRRCRRACGIPATKTQKHDIVQYMLHHGQDVQNVQSDAHTSDLQHDSGGVELMGLHHVHDRLHSAINQDDGTEPG